MLLASLLFCGCPPSSLYDEFYSRSFVLRYCRVSDISIERRNYPEDDPDYNLGYFIRVVADKLYRANRSGEEKQVFDALCEKYNDVTYDRKVRYSYDEYNPPPGVPAFLRTWRYGALPTGMPVIRRERRSMTSCVSKAIPPGLISGVVIRSGIPTRKGASTIRSTVWFRNLRQTT